MTKKSTNVMGQMFSEWTQRIMRMYINDFLHNNFLHKADNSLDFVRRTRIDEKLHIGPTNCCSQIATLPLFEVGCAIGIAGIFVSPQSVKLWALGG